MEYEITIEQIERDINTLNEEFTKMSGVWEHYDGDECAFISENELELCKGISSRYPFEYNYKPSEFDKNPNNLDEDWSNVKFDVDDFNNNNIDDDNYVKVDAVADDFRQELIGMLDKLKEELKWLPKRFHEEFIELICECPQDRHSIRKNCEYFSESILDELTKEEKSRMFVTL